jgi:hypothetical protein
VGDVFFAQLWWRSLFSLCRTVTFAMTPHEAVILSGVGCVVAANAIERYVVILNRFVMGFRDTTLGTNIPLQSSAGRWRFMAK